MYTVKLKLPSCWVKDLTEEYPNLELNVLSFSVNRESICMSQVLLSGVPKSSLSRVLNHPDIVRYVLLDSIRDIHLLNVYYTCPFIDNLIDGGVSLIVPFYACNGIVEWKYTGSDIEPSLKTIIEIFEAHGLRCRISKRNIRDRLTLREKYILFKAISEGYYDYPRRINLSNLAKKLNISKATLSEYLMKIESKIMRKLCIVG